MTTTDPHVLRAAELFGVDTSDVSPTMRSYAKLRSHAEAYAPPTFGLAESRVTSAEYAAIEARILFCDPKAALSAHLKKHPHLDPCGRFVAKDPPLTEEPKKGDQ